MLQTPLPTVESACAALEQEEAQRSVLGESKPRADLMAMFSRNNPEINVTCNVCGVKGHSGSRCWRVIGYPPWYPKHSKSGQAPRRNVPNSSNSRWNTRTPNTKTAANAQLGPSNDSSGLCFTPQQLEQLAKLVPQLSMGQVKSSDTDDELDEHFSGMVSCLNAQSQPTEWIVDSGASDHMAYNLASLQNCVPFSDNSKINMPTGDNVVIFHIGKVSLAPGLVLDKVLCVPAFKHNLLSVHKLLADNNCTIQFYDTYCTIIDCETQKIRAVGTARNGLYYISTDTSVNSANMSTHTQPQNSVALWHHRLGHASINTIKHLPFLKVNSPVNQICISCPMAKFSKLHFNISTSQASESFELVHMDIWGPYRVPYKSKYRYFLTLVDDYSRNTWIYLLQLKSDALAFMKKFLEYAFTHFGKKIKYIRSDNALGV